jgi:hypothetical protein
VNISVLEFCLYHLQREYLSIPEMCRHKVAQVTELEGNYFPHFFEGV